MSRITLREFLESREYAQRAGGWRGRSGSGKSKYPYNNVRSSLSSKEVPKDDDRSNRLDRPWRATARPIPVVPSAPNANPENVSPSGQDSQDKPISELSWWRPRSSHLDQGIQPDPRRTPGSVQSPKVEPNASFESTPPAIEPNPSTNTSTHSTLWDNNGPVVSDSRYRDVQALKWAGRLGG